MANTGGRVTSGSQTQVALFGLIAGLKRCRACHSRSAAEKGVERMRLENKTALITGGAGDVERSVARVFLRDAFLTAKPVFGGFGHLSWESRRCGGTVYRHNTLLRRDFR